MAIRAVSPLVGLSPPEGDALFDGRVTERLIAGPYVYFAVVNADLTVRWAVTLNVDAPAVGDWVHVKSFGVKEPFYSKSLGRSFDRLHFARVVRVDDREGDRVANATSDARRSQ